MKLHRLMTQQFGFACKVKYFQVAILIVLFFVGGYFRLDLVNPYSGNPPGSAAVDE